MTIKYMKGYIKVGQYDGPGVTASGKKYTQFALSVRKEGGGREYVNGFRVWDGGFCDASEVIDGAYRLIEYDETPWATDEAKFNRSVRDIWSNGRADGAETRKKPAETPYADDDLPF